jgi:hypothetical protein
MKNKGLYKKYIISKVDGTSINPENEYFVLKLKGDGDPEHMKACRKAVLKYADEIRNYLPELSEDIYLRYGYENDEVLKKGYVKITGSEVDFEKVCKESELIKIGKEIFADHPGEEGYYNFIKFLWVQFPDEREECRLDCIVPYD